jgi:hypothetical protein
VFAGQLVHSSEPVLPLNLPAMQAAHPRAFEPVYPKLHKHMVELLLPTIETALAVHAMQVVFDVAAVAVENRFAGQSVHGTAPVCALCLPAWHAKHGKPSCPVCCE